MGGRDRLTLADFPVTDGKSVGVIGWERGGRFLFLRKRNLTPGAAGCCFCFHFFLLIFRGWRTRRLSEAGRGGLRRGVSRMDAATELTWTYLQRPLRSPSRPARHGCCFNLVPSQPRGAPPLAVSAPKAR